MQKYELELQICIVAIAITELIAHLAKASKRRLNNLTYIYMYNTVKQKEA